MNILSYQFEGPFSTELPFNSDFGAVYTIINSVDQLIDVGQTGSVNNRMPNHERKNLWQAYKQAGLSLYIYPEQSESKRLLIESQIRNAFNPPCGER